MGTTLDAIINEEKRYYAPLNPLVKLYRGELNGRVLDIFHDAVSKLRTAAEQLIEYIEKRAETPLAKFTIGKSYARKIKNKDFDASDFDTWKKEGIKSRWAMTYQKKGYNGLVVLCGITRELLPLVPNKGSKRHPLQDQQQYALVLEQQLIHHFLFEAQDNRLGNESLDIGKLAQNPYAGVVYLAFKLYTIREVWQLFQDAFELEEEPDDTIFVISIEDQKKIIGGRKAEKQVITFFHKEGGNLGGLRIGIFVNYIPSLEFVQNLSYIGQDVIIARKLTKTNKPALQMLSNKFCNAREFAEDDWIELGRTLQLPVDGISHQKAIELEEFKTYLEKPKDEILEIFQESMAETEKQKQEKAEPNDAVFVIRYTYAGNREKVEDGRIINGKNVENRVIDFLKEKKNKKKLDIKINVNYKPSQRFLDFQKDFVRTRQEYIGWVNVCFGSEDEIDETADGTVVITMTELDYDELKKYLDQIEYLYL